MSETAARAFRFDAAHQTDVGQVRSINEDSLLVNPLSQLWLVADGMGGHAAGDFASQTIVAHLDTMGAPVSRDDMKQRFVERLTHANTRILQHAAELGRGAIGSTVAALMAFEERFVCYWSGDSRVYRSRQGALRRVTKDHTEVQALLDAGAISPAEAATWPRKNVITHAIGVTEIPEFDVIEGTLADGDLFLICSDGLTEYFEDAEIERMLSDRDVDLNQLCSLFVREAVQRGGKDNVTVVIVRAVETALPETEVDGQYPEFGGWM